MNFIDFEGTKGTEGASQTLDQELWLGPSLPHRPRYEPFFRFNTQGNALETQSQVQGSLFAPFGPTHLNSPNPQSTTGNIEHAQPARIPAPVSSPPVQLGQLIHLDYELFIPSVVHEVAHSANLSNLEIQKGTVSWQVAVVGARGYGISADVRASTEEHYIKFVEVADVNRNNKLIVKLSMIDPEQPVKKDMIVNQQVKGLTFHFGNQAEREQVARETACVIVNPKANTSTDPVTLVMAQIVERVVAKYGRDKEQLCMGHGQTPLSASSFFPSA
ncbi:hypothetical protein KEM48_010890 [Puccinia striiformis f. sp. tritici PST-130]|nr:hypothetical protein KEM48_010890 [Puccinia striiformis f. sp. tritici PST-130]